ncbi:hypothetical protein ACFV4G_01565 [Kitasatospora sp. NPDC059747]|uniref:hypothetical protein n=1 Tax=Kitasatospora sp. NPDC059747 TaxID=3346930 RepID=UPI0036608001
MNSRARKARWATALATTVALLAGGAGTALADGTATTPVTAVPVGTVVTGVVVSPDGSRAYVTADGKLKVVDTAAGTVTAEIPLGGLDYTSDKSAISPDGTRVYAVSGLVLYVVDTTTNTVVATVPLPPEIRPDTWKDGGAYQVAIGTDGGTVLVAQDGPSGYLRPGQPPTRTPGRVLTFATAQGAFTGEVPMPDGYVRRIAVRPGGTDAYVSSGTSLVHLDLSAGTPTAVGTVANLPAQVIYATYTKDGTHLIVTDSDPGDPRLAHPVDTDSDTATAPVTLTPDFSTGGAPSTTPAGGLLRRAAYDQTTKRLSLVAFDSTADYAAVPGETLPTDADFSYGMTVSSDNHTVYLLAHRPGVQGVFLEILPR